MTIGQEQVLNSLKAGVTVCAISPEGKKVLVSRNFWGEGYVVAHLPASELGFWDGDTMWRLPDIRSWEVTIIGELSDEWTMVRVYNPNIIIDPPTSGTRY